MSEFPAVPVPEKGLEELYRQTVSMQGMQVLQWRKAATRARWSTAALVVLCTSLVVTIAAMLPLRSYVPVFVFTNSDGVNDTATAISDLPPDTRVAGIEATLWTYLRLREHYAASEADESYTTVSAFSDDLVRQQYQKWSNPKLNKDAPAVKLGPRGFIRIYRESGSWVSHAPSFDDGVYKINFCRVVVPDGQQPIGQRMTETLHYHLMDRVPLWQRLTFNAVGLTVTDYASPEALDQPRIVSFGGDPPCGH